MLNVFSFRKNQNIIGWYFITYMEMKYRNKWSENMYRTHFLSLVVNQITENGLQENVKPV